MNFGEIHVLVNSNVLKKAPSFPKHHNLLRPVLRDYGVSRAAYDEKRNGFVGKLASDSSTAILAVWPAGILPAVERRLDRQDARRPHRLEACAPAQASAFQKASEI